MPKLLGSSSGAQFNKTIVDIEFYPAGDPRLHRARHEDGRGHPDAFTSQGGGPASDPLLFKALRAAGFKGQLFNAVPLTSAQVAKVVPIECFGVWSTRFPRSRPTIRRHRQAAERCLRREIRQVG